MMSLNAVKSDSDKDNKARLRYIATTVELLFAFIFISWSVSHSSAYFPTAVKLLRRGTTLVANHHFVFLLGNLIVVTLLLKSGHSTSASKINRPNASPETPDGDEIDLIRQFLPPTATEEVEVVESDPVPRRRTRSEERFGVELMTERSVVELRRSETSETGRKSRWMDAEVEDLNNDEFQRKVEAFIERQQRFLREEESVN